MKPTVTLDRKLFALFRAIALAHDVPLKALIEETLVAAFVSKEIFAVFEQDEINLISNIYGIDLDKLNDERLKAGSIFSRDRKPKRKRRRRVKKNPT